jgi:pimeloyl-ACP methyl ester carboxylesterase
MNRNRWIAGGVVGGAIGAAATGAVWGVAGRWARLARERRAAREDADGDGPAELGMLPPGTPWSVVADDGVRLAAEVIEPADGRPALTVVLVHGFALDRRCWHFQRRALAALTEPSVRVVLFDLRSHGASERARRSSCTISRLGSDLDAVLRTLAPEGPVVLVGHSMGGMAIMALAEQHPRLLTERVAGVALLCTSAGEVASAGLPGTFLSRRNPLTRGVGTLARMAPKTVERTRRMVADLVWGITRAYSYGDRDVDVHLVDFVHAMISANGVDALVDFVDTLNTHDRLAALPGLAHCRALIVAAEADRIIPASHSDLIAAELPDARLLRLPGAGHMAMLEQPQEVDDALVELIAACVEDSRPTGLSRWLRQTRRRA